MVVSTYEVTAAEVEAAGCGTEAEPVVVEILEDESVVLSRRWRRCPAR